MNLRLTSIQRFSVFDGPGIRTTLFAKGCSIRCPWCSNPENLDYEIQNYRTDGGIVKQFGKDFSVQEVFDICMKDKEFYGEQGGVTASGGEAMLQFEALSELFALLKEQSINCGIETSLYIPKKSLIKMVELLDFAYVDMKIMNLFGAKEKLKADYELYLENLDFLFKNFDRSKVIIRIPVVTGYTDSKENIKTCKELLSKYTPGSCELFSVHNLGAVKYRILGWEYKAFTQVSQEILEYYCEYLSDIGIKVSINEL